MDYAHLHAHSEYTLTDGSMRIDEYVDRLEELEIPAGGLTDTHNMFGAFKFHEKALSRGIKPVLGVDLRVAPEGRARLGNVEQLKRLRVLIQNREGYERLSYLLSESYRKRHERGLYVTLDELSGETDGLFFLGPASIPPDREVKTWDRDDADTAVEEGLDRFGDRFFVEIPLYPSRLEHYESLVESAREKDVQPVPTRPAYFDRPGEEERLRLRRAVQNNVKLEDSPALPPHRPNQYVTDPSKLESLAGRLDLSLDVTLELANECYFEFETDQIRLPSYPYGDDNTNQFLADRCRDAVEKKQFDVDAGRVEERLARELEVIQSMGFSDYFLIVADVVNWARKNEIRVGPGRGSAAGSLVAYLLDITTVDPFEFDLVFERFLNPSRNEMPDIDIDFADDRRGEVIEYIRERFGEESVAHIITFGKMKARNSIRDVGRIRNEPQARIDELAETIPSGTSDSLKRLKNHMDPLKRKIESDSSVEQWFEQARKLEGMVRNASVHAAGILIIEGRLDREVPLYFSDEPEAVPASQYDMYDVEKMGYLKLDVLGLKTLTLIERTLDHIPEPDRPDVDGLPPDDPATFEFLLEGSLEGIFQFESAGSRELVRNMEPASRKDIVDCIALYRPGPMEIRDDYLKRRNNPDLVEYPHEDLEPILGDTYGLILYQEQVMAIAREIGGFTWSEADTLRKAMGKKRADLMSDMKDQFVEGARSGGYDADWASELFETLAQFAEYGFNRSHSAAYGEITYITAYLKAHFPTEFYSALLSVKYNDRDRVRRIIRGMREDDVDLLPPSINQSGADFTVEDDAVRFGLKAVKHVGSKVARAIEEERRETPFEDLVDFVARIDPANLQTQNFQALAVAGCFDEFGAPRGWVVDNAEELLGRGKKRYEERSAGQSNLFGDESESRLEDNIPSEAQWSERQRLRAQKKVLGFVPSDEGEESEQTELADYTYPGTIEKFGEIVSSNDDSILGNPQVIARPSGVMKENDETFIKLKNNHEEIVVRAEDVELPGKKGSPCLVDFQRVGSDWVVSRLAEITGPGDVGIEIHLGGSQDLSQLQQLKEIFQQLPGQSPVRLVLHGEDQKIDVSHRIERSTNLLGQVERVLGKNRLRLYLVEKARS